MSSACHNPPIRDYAASRSAPPPTCGLRNQPSRFDIRHSAAAIRPITSQSGEANLGEFTRDFMRRVPDNAQLLELGTNVSGMLCMSFTCGLGLGCIPAAAHLPLGGIEE